MRIYFFNMLTCTYRNKRIDSVSSELLILEKKTIANQWFGGLLCFCEKSFGCCSHGKYQDRRGTHPDGAGPIALQLARAGREAPVASGGLAMLQRVAVLSCDSLSLYILFLSVQSSGHTCVISFFWLQMCLSLEFTPLCSASLAMVFPGLFHWKFLLHHLSLQKQTRHNCLQRLFCELFFLYFPNVYWQQWDESDGKVLWVQVRPRSSRSSVSSSALCIPAKHVGIMKRSQIFSVLISISSLSTSTIP